MTCSLFRDLNSDDQRFMAMASSERLACTRHFDGCPACQDWLKAQPPTVDTTSPWVQREIAAMVAKDLVALLSDPEVL